MINEFLMGIYSKNFSSVLGGIIVFVTVTKLISTALNDRNKNKLPLVPYKYPLIGSTIDYYKNPHGLIKSLTKKYGPRFRMHFHGDVMTVVAAEDAIEVFNHPELNFMTSQNKYFSLEILHGSEVNKLVRDVGVISIMKDLMPKLNDYTAKAYGEFLHDVKLIEDTDKEFVVPDLLPFLKKFISRSSSRMIVGDLCRNEDLFYVFENSVTDIGKSFMPSILQVILPVYNRIHMRYFYKKSGVIEKYRNILKNIIEKEAERQKQLYRKDEPSGAFSYFLYNHFPVVDNEAIHMLTTVLLVYIFVAAHTTSEAINYVFYCLVKYPEYMKELQKEQEEIFAELESSSDTIRSNGELIPSIADCRRMVKLDSFIHEALRLRKGGVGLSHTNISDHDVVLKSGVIIKPGEEVYINLWHVNYDEGNQFPFKDLEKFDAFRHVGTDKNATKSSRDNIIFGVGKHTCPGRWFATFQMKSIISYFIRNYDITAQSEIKMTHSENEHVGLPTGSVKFTKRTTV